MYRTRKRIRQYNPRRTRKQLNLGTKACPFCVLPDKQIVETGKSMLVIKNIFPYQFWDFMKVTEHLMVVPKRHVDSISQLNRDEKHELIEVLADYQGRGFNMYGREKGNVIKSVPHQHTHLLKCDSKTAKFYLYLRKPYLLIRR